MSRTVMVIAAIACLLSVAREIRGFLQVGQETWWTAKGRAYKKRLQAFGAIIRVALFPIVLIANAHWTLTVLAWILSAGYCFDAIVFLLHRPVSQPPPPDAENGEERSPEDVDGP